MKEYIFYQIYPKTFCDSNGDGVGDLQGIRSKIGYLKTLGITAVWLSPCYSSPWVDNGYDISDYTDIERSIGTLSQMKALISEFKANGIAVILDFVANHTSTAHKWFQQAKSSKDNPYRDYYIWRKTPPNAWQSVFGGSAWEYDKTRDEYYLHSFDKTQADLNWENPKVREEMSRVVDFWLDMGADGFRCDVLDMISKDFDKGMNGNGPRLHEYIRELFGRERTDNIFTVGECWSADTNNVKLFCAKGRKELTTVFTFDHLCMDEGRFLMKKPSLQELCRRVSAWQTATQKAGILPTVFFGNHDQPRAVSRFGNEREYRFESATFLGALTLLHRGYPFLFQGEELGLVNPAYGDIRLHPDIESQNYYKANLGKIPQEELIRRIDFAGRDNARAPFPWAEVRLEKNAVLQFYKKLISLRKTELCLQKGAYVCVENSDKRYIFRREYGEERITVVCNFEKASPIWKAENATLILSNYQGEDSLLQPYQINVYKSE